MSKVARRKQLLTATPAMSIAGSSPDGASATAFAAPPTAAAAVAHARWPGGPRRAHRRRARAVRAQRRTRRGGEQPRALSVRARACATSIVMPLYDIARANVAGHRAGRDRRSTSGRARGAKRCGSGGSSRRREHPLASTDVYFIESEEYFTRPYIYGPPGRDYPDNARRYACFTHGGAAPRCRRSPAPIRCCCTRTTGTRRSRRSICARRSRPTNAIGA